MSPWQRPDKLLVLRYDLMERKTLYVLDLNFSVRNWKIFSRYSLIDGWPNEILIETIFPLLCVLYLSEMNRFCDDPWVGKEINFSWDSNWQYEEIKKINKKLIQGFN